MKKLFLTLAFVFSLGMSYEASASWIIIINNYTGDYDAVYIDDGKDNVVLSTIG